MDTIHPAVNAKSQAISGELQLRQFGAFLETHDRLLSELSADDSRTGFHSSGGGGEGGGQPTATQCAPVRLRVGRHEQLAHHQLANTNNTVLNKIVCTFAELCTEVRRLGAEAEVQQLRFLFADELVGGDEKAELAEPAMADEEQQQQHALLVRISEQLELLCEIQQLVQRCVLVGAETLRQMGAFFGSSSALVATTSTATNPAVQLQIVFHQLADLGRTLLCFDQILQRSNLHEHWPQFTKAIDTLRDHQFHFSGLADSAAAYSQHDLDGLRNILADLDQQLFAGDLFGTFIIGLQAVRSAMSAEAANRTAQHWDAYMRAQLHRLDRPQPANSQPHLCNDFAERPDLIRCTVSAILLHTAFGRLDAAIAARLYAINTRHCGLTLLEHFPWLPDQLIARHIRFAPKSAAAKALQRYVTEAQRLRSEAGRSRLPESRITQLAQLLCARTLAWQMQMRAAASGAAAATPQSGVQLAARASLLLDGLRLMGECSHLAKLITQQHIEAGAVMTKATLANVCRLLEHYRTVRTVYDELAEFCAGATQSACQHLAYQSLAVIQQTIGRKFASHLAVVAAAYSERDIDQLSALQLAERSLQGPATDQRLLVARLALSIADPTAVFTVDHLEILSDRLGRLETVLDMERLLRRRPDTTFVYWHRALLVGFGRQVVAPQSDSAQFPTPHNSVHFLGRLNGAVLPASAAAAYRIDVVDQLLRHDYLSRLCSHIETNLRLSVHTYMHDTAPTSATALVANAAQHRLEAAASGHLLRLIAVRPLPLGDHHFVFRQHAEHYMSRTFYNLTAVALPDGRTYSEMRCLARHKYGLRLVDDQLPAETIEQGLDLLDVMRFQADFCAKFVYDMNAQQFLQAQSGNQFLNTLSVAHVVNSLRTHGLGIVNTAINGGYKQLCQLMPAVSRFLYADKVRSALAKCGRHFADQRQRSATAGFSFDLARQLVKTAPRLCATDQSMAGFLATITQIGNIMGYVRLVRSAAIRCVCRAGVFVPVGANGADVALAARAEELRLPAATAEAAWNVHVNVATLCKDFVRRPDYFRSFLQAFTAVVRDVRNGHLGQFYLVLPALSVMFVEGLLRSKEYRHKGGGGGAGEAAPEQRLVFTDDGFAMGVAYVLVVLGQVEAFWTLDWFGEVERKYRGELAELEAKRTGLGSSFEDEKLRQTLLLTGRRIAALAEEFELLRCNLRCALRFFQ